jgi:hypothetical protein
VLSEAFATLELSQHLLNLITEFPALISLDEVPIASNPVWLKEWARMEFWGMLPTSGQSPWELRDGPWEPLVAAHPASAGGSPIGWSRSKNRRCHKLGFSVEAQRLYNQ